MPAWLIFLLSGAVVAAAGMRLAHDGDTIAEETGLGGMWVGAIAVAAATSLPELLTDLAAVRQGSPNLAVGDLFGSCMANMMVLAVADLAIRNGRMLTRVAVNQALVGILAIGLLLIAALGILIGGSASVLGLGWSSVLIAAAYVGGMRVMHANRSEPPFRSESELPEPHPRSPAMRRALIGFGVAALAILVAAPYLASSTAALADQLGIGRGLAGMILLAITTSLPEIAVSWGSVRHGYYDLAVGNLLGSNCFNMAVLAPLDIAYGSGALMAAVDPNLAIGALFAALMMGLALMDVLNKAERRVWMVEPIPALMACTYVGGMLVLWRLGVA